MNLRHLIVAMIGLVPLSGCAAKHEGVDAKPTSPPSKSYSAVADPMKWRGLDLAAAPLKTSDWSKLPDIWEERPPGSKSYEVRDDVTVIPPKNAFTDGTVYWIKSRNTFYVQRDSPDSSQKHFYGPFEGDPNEVLDPRP